MKKLVYILSIILTLNIVISPDKTFAQQKSGTENKCEAQNQTPEKLENYIQNIQDLLGSISPNNTLKPEEKKEAKKENYNSELSNLADKLKDLPSGVTKKVESTLYQAMPFVKGEITDVFLNFKVLQNSDMVIRDWNKLLALDKLIANKGTQLGIRGGDSELIDTKDKQKINNILSKLDVFASKPSLKTDDITKAQLVGLLFQTNLYYKKIFLEATNTSHNGDDLKNLNNFFADNVERFGLQGYDATHLAQLSKSYEGCAGIEMTFGKFMTQFNEGIDNIIDMGGSGFDSTWRSMKNSYSNLKCFMFNNCGVGQYDSMISKQNKLLEDQGIDPNKGGMSNMFGLGNAWENLKEGANLDALKGINFDKFDNKTNTPTAKENEQPLTQAVEQKANINSYKDIMKTTFNGVINSQETVVSDGVNEKPTFLKQLPDLSKQVYKGVKVVGDPTKTDEDSILSNLVARCEKQASNAGGTCINY